MDLGNAFFKRRGVFTVSSVVLLFLQSCYSNDFQGIHLGCFEKGSYDLYHEVKNPSSSETVHNCVRECKQEYFRYAGLQNSATCSCGSSHATLVKGNCFMRCSNNSSQSCGGPDSVDVYDTGIRVPGPPSSLVIQNVSSISVLLSWGPPKITNGDIKHYEITAFYLKTYSNSPLNSPMEWKYSNSSLRADLFGFHPGTVYNISVRAISEEGPGAMISQLFSTVIGDPDVPDVPKIIKRENDKITIKLEPATNNFGPVSSYRIVVIDDSSPVSFDVANLESWSFSQCARQNGSANCAQQDGIPYYIAAELKPEELPEEFVVGDGQIYGNFYNAPLMPESDIHISLGIVSTMNGISKASYALPTHEQHQEFIPNDSVLGEPDTGLVVGLSIAIGIFGFLLLLSIVGYFLLKRKLERRRGALDHQELSLQGPMVEVESSGYIHDAYIVEDEGPPNHYENLKKKVWNIPKNFLEVRTEVIGQGKYGSVVKGSVKKRGNAVPATIHYIEDEFNRRPGSKPMLEDFDKLIRTSPHTNVIDLVGTSEIPEALLVVLEYHPASLKDILLESRCLEQDGLSHNQDKFCSLQEGYLLEVGIGVARGMDHLIQRKVVHGKLCARNVLMADGMVPKIAGFGLAEYTKNSVMLDYTRWTAQEIFKNRHIVSKSDVWSFGCLLWEIVTFGGTLYVEVPTRDVPTRVMRGLRPLQPSYVGDDLYQFMLQCWQIDLDERPNFSEATTILEDLLRDSEVHLNFDTYSGFHYEPYIPELEQLK